MAFANKLGNLLKQAVSSHPSLYQAIRCMSSSKLFVGGLPYATDDQSLQEAFKSYGEVVEARVIMDRETGRSRGFGFVTFTSTEDASNAISGMDGKDLQGRIVRVNYATDRTSGFRGGGGGYGGGGYGGSYGGGSSVGYGGGGGNYGGGSYNNSGGYSAGSGGDSYGSGSSYGGGSSGAYGSSIGSVAGDEGGSDGYVGTPGGAAAKASGGGEQYASNQSSVDDYNNTDASLDADDKLDDEPEDYANRRA